jgi:hypothetical protein
MKLFFTGLDEKRKKKSKKKLDPNAQQIILENAIVKRIQNEVFRANAFDLRNFRLRLVMEEATQID